MVDKCTFYFWWVLDLFYREVLILLVFSTFFLFLSMHVLFYSPYEKVKRTLSQSIVESDIQITTSFPTTLQVNVIPAYLESIIFNLISNAIKYKSPHRRPLLNIGYEINEQYTVITFKDNGLGLNLNKNGHKIFGMYKTFHGNNDARGIGLYLTKNQIEAMNGKIEVESEEGVGSVFKIYLNEK